MDNKVRRIGVIIPPGNVAVEREFPSYLPPGLVMNSNRLGRPDNQQTKESILAMNATLPQTARDLAQTHPDVIVYACTGGSFLEGLGREGEVAVEIERATGIPGISTSVAVVEALRAFRTRKVFLVGPYPHDIMRFEQKFLDHHGFDSPRYITFECMTSEANRALTSEGIAEAVLAEREAIAGCDAVFISCTNILVMDRIEFLESELRKPVVTSNQATLWQTLCHLGLDTRGLHGGRLFEEHGPAAAAH